MAFEELKERSRAVWNAGDYGPTSRQLEPVSEMLVAGLDIGAGDTVLDVAAGHGNCAIAAARRGAVVTASDFSPAMIASGKARTDAAGLEIEWREADAADLPFDKGSFDCLTSVFGLIFAPEQEQVAAEVLRVLRPGGRAGLTAWTPDSYTARLIEIPRAYAPASSSPPPDPLRWGNEEEVRALLEGVGAAVDIRRATATFRYASWADWRESSEAHGMAVVAKQAMPADLYEEVFARMQAVTQEHSRIEAGTIVVDSDYLEIVARKP